MRYCPRRGTLQATLDVPLEVLLMNWATTALLWLALLIPLITLSRWVLHHPVFAIERVEVDGDFIHNTPNSWLQEYPKIFHELDLIAKFILVQDHLKNTLPENNFFTLNIYKARDTLENIDWVRKVAIMRIFPNKLYLYIERHQPVAWWGREKSSLMVSDNGKIFNNNFLEKHPEQLGNFFSLPSHLPHLVAPSEDSAEELLHMYQRLAPLLAPLQSPIFLLEQTPYGRWRVELASGTLLELGVSDSTDITALLRRVQHLVNTLPQLLHQQGYSLNQLEYADVRYVGGYTVKYRHKS